LAAVEANSITDGPFGSKLKTEHYTPSGPRVVRLQNIGDAEFVDARAHISEAHYSTLQKHRVVAGDIVIAALGETLPRSCLIPDSLGPAIVKADCIRFKPDPKHSARYLNYALNWEGTQKRTKAIVHGVGRPRLNLSEIKSIQVPIAPLTEQHRIVAEIEKQLTRLEAGVAALRRVQANAKRYRAAVLKAACDGRLVPTEAALAHRESRAFDTGKDLLDRIRADRRERWSGRGKYEPPSAIGETDHTLVPDGWAKATLDEIGQEGRPIIYGIIKPGPHVPDGIPYVRVTEMKDGSIDPSTLRRTSHERAAKFRRATLASGDVLISKDGTIGRVAVVPPELAGANITQHVMRAPIHQYVARDFVVWAIRSDQCQRWLTGETRGVALRGVNVEDFRRLPIPLPPVAEQGRIVAEVDRRTSVVDELEDLVVANLRRAARLRQSILQRAFSGELVTSIGSD
jgi:type I restriction enzyme S subunit